MKIASLATALFLGMSISASAASVTVYAGDEDCFGLDGSCAVGDLFRDDLGGSFFTDNSTPSDAVGTDSWDLSAGLGGPSLDFDLSGVGTILSATLSIFYAGLELGTGGDVMVNGTSVGSIQTFGANDFQLVDLGVFGGIEALLTAFTTISITTSEIGDGFIVDYAKLELTTMPAIPVPASLPLLLGAVGGLALLRRRKKKSTA